MAGLHLRFELRVEDGCTEITNLYLTASENKEKPNAFRSCFWRTMLLSCCIQPNGGVSFISRLSQKILSYYSGVLKI